MNINISFTGMEPSDALKSYLEEKITKHEELFKDISSVDVVLKENVNAKGVDKDFTLMVNVILPRAVVRVQESGEDMYAIIDKGTDVLVRRLRRYYDRRSNWDGTTPWRVLEAQEALEVEVDEVVESYSDYAPKISLRKKLSDLTPMPEGEAIEKMELMGDRQILFKNSATGKVSMIYTERDGNYVLVEPSDSLEL